MCRRIRRKCIDVWQLLVNLVSHTLWYVLFWYWVGGGGNGSLRYLF